MWLNREIAYLAMIVAIVVVAIICIKKKKVFSYTLSALILTTYIGVTVSLVFFPLLVEAKDGMVVPDLGWNIIPLKGIIDSYSNFSTGHADLFFKEVLGNFVMLAPLGFLLPIIFDRFRNAKSMVIIGLATGFGIELIQLLLGLSVGSLYRNVNIDDALLNFAGCMLGYLVYRIAARIISRK